MMFKHQSKLVEILKVELLNTKRKNWLDFQMPKLVLSSRCVISRLTLVTLLFARNCRNN